ncbi:MAG: 3-methyl-2-oxobutanoate dehydrogenase subunit VorB [Phycisphaerales bacterium]|nr:MAG: 3-methyl-2-oxobutanoate dehydrogenase subunit VorB [Phycisphaerales bacterium]
MAKVLMKGCEAIGEAAIRAGCRNFFGYPITPQTEVPEYLAKRFPEVDGSYVQAESEVAAINMLYGGAGVGKRVLTTSSSPGISLMAEGVSYIAACHLPIVFVNIVRAGPGLGGILPAQSDYLQATKGHGHGDYKLLVLAPASVQEAVDLIYEAFDLADHYLTPVMVMGDGMIGQMMEPVDLPDMRDLSDLVEKPWAATGACGRGPNIINSLYLKEDMCNANSWKLKEKADEIERKEQRSEAYACPGDVLDVLVVAYGTMARICKTAADEVKKKDKKKVGVFRPISLWPYPYEALAAEAKKAKKILVVEMSTGQMVEDVKLAVLGKKPIEFYGLTGGMVPSPDNVAHKLRSMIK